MAKKKLAPKGSHKRPHSKPSLEFKEPMGPIAQALGLGLMIEVLGREFRSYKRGRQAGFAQGVRSQRARTIANLEAEEE